MKSIRLCLLWALAMTSIAAGAQVQTSDHFTISELKFDPAENYAPYFTVGVECTERLYTCYNMTIELPAGMTFAMENGNPMIFINHSGDIYPSNHGSYSHTVSAKVVDDSNGMKARVACLSTSNAELTDYTGPLFDVYIDYNAWVKAGQNRIMLWGLNLTANDPWGGDPIWYQPENDLNVGDIDISGDNREVSVSITAENGVSTCILPFDYTLPSEVTAYALSEATDDSIVFEPVETMKAYKPYLLVAQSGYTAIFTGNASSADFPSLYPGQTTISDNGLVGVLATTEVSQGYVMQNQGSGANFYRIGSTPFSIKAGKCYYDANSSNGLFKIRINDKAGVSVIEMDLSEDEALYDLFGRRIQNPANGQIYICNGKKSINQK